MLILSVIFPVVALTAIGYGAGRTIVPAATVRALVNVVNYIEIPVLLFRALAHQDLVHDPQLGISAVYFAGCFAVLLLALAVGRWGFGLKLDEAGVFGMGAMYSNSSLLGIPLIQTAFGTAGLVLLTKIIAFHSLILIPLSTVIVTVGRGDVRGVPAMVRSAALAALCNPIIIGLLAGAVWSLAGWPLPGPIDRVLEMLAVAASPTALIAMGATQAHFRVGGHLAQVAAGSALKLVLHPLLVWLLAAEVAGLPHEAVAVATITAALPPGINVYLMAQQYGCGVARAASTSIVASLLSALSVGAALAWVGL
jgi:malonate transporter and related proteins